MAEAESKGEEEKKEVQEEGKNQEEQQAQQKQEEPKKEDQQLALQEEDPIQVFESLVAKYGKTMNLNMFKYFHAPGFTKKHPPDVNTIRYILDGKKVKVGCICGASLDLTDYKKLEE